MTLLNLLPTGFPIDHKVVIPWNTSFDQTAQHGKPIVRNWNRWGEAEGKVQLIHFFSLTWDLHLPSLPSLHRGQVNYHFPPSPPLFKTMNCYFQNPDDALNQLTQVFGPPYIDRISFLDKGGVEVGYDHQVWKPLNDFPLTISFHASGPVIFSVA